MCTYRRGSDDVLVEGGLGTLRQDLADAQEDLKRLRRRLCVAYARRDRLNFVYQIAGAITVRPTTGLGEALVSAISRFLAREYKAFDRNIAKWEWPVAFRAARRLLSARKNNVHQQTITVQRAQRRLEERATLIEVCNAYPDVLRSIIGVYTYDNVYVKRGDGDRIDVYFGPDGPLSQTHGHIIIAEGAVRYRREPLQPHPRALQR